MSEIVYELTGVSMSRQTVWNIINKGMLEFIEEEWNLIEKKLAEKGKIFEFFKKYYGGVLGYDEQWEYINGVKHYCLILVNTTNYRIIRRELVNAKDFNKEYLLKFLKDNIDLEQVHTLVTDGNSMYKDIIAELGIKQKRCTFHNLQLLMAFTLSRRRSMKRKIRNKEEK